MLQREFERYASTFAAAEILDPTRRATFIQRADRVAETALFSVEWEDVATGFVVLGLSYLLASLALRPIHRGIEDQKRFIAQASHELKTPLAILKAEMELFLRHRTLVRKREDVLANIAEIDRMGGVIEMLLILSRIDSNIKTFHFARVNLTALVVQAVRRLQRYNPGKAIKWSINVSEHIVIFADSLNLDQAISNILKNAADYSLPRSKILVTVKTLDDKAAVEVIDKGVGIAKEDLPHIFDRFYRGKYARTTRTGGAGLGLFISKWIIAQHKGKINVESSPGKGTTFTVFLPLAVTS